MGFLIKQILSFVKILNSETGTNQIAAGIAMGFVLGLCPGLSLQTMLVFFCIFLFRIQMGAAFLSAGVFALLSIPLARVFHAFGAWILSIDSLQGLFTSMYNMPLVPLTRFNNSVVMGAGVLSIILWPAMFFLAKYLVKKYRVAVLERFKQSKAFKVFKASFIYKIYYKYDSLYNG